MAQDIKQVMKILDKVLATTVWVNSERQIVSLADELKSKVNPRGIEDLSRPSLIGAFVSLQIRSDNFSVSAESLTTEDLASRVKEMVFAEAKQILDSQTTQSLAKVA